MPGEAEVVELNLPFCVTCHFNIGAASTGSNEMACIFTSAEPSIDISSTSLSI